MVKRVGGKESAYRPPVGAMMNEDAGALRGDMELGDNKPRVITGVDTAARAISPAGVEVARQELQAHNEQVAAAEAENRQVSAETGTPEEMAAFEKSYRKAQARKKEKTPSYLEGVKQAEPLKPETITAETWSDLDEEYLNKLENEAKLKENMLAVKAEETARGEKMFAAMEANKNAELDASDTEQAAVMETIAGDKERRARVMAERQRVIDAMVARAKARKSA